jgi:tetratricopeptide (TPR) repeat protein
LGKKPLTPSNPEPANPEHKSDFSDSEWVVEYSDLDIASNSVVDLIHEGKLDEAETAAHKLLADYPEVHDGFERLAMVYEARGDSRSALDMYERTLDFTMDKGDDYDEEMRIYYRRKIAKLKKKLAPKPKKDT